MEQAQMKTTLGEITKARKIFGQRPPDAWLEILTHLELLDQKTERKGKRAFKIIISSFILLFVSGFIGAAIFPPALFLIPFGIAGFIFGIFSAIRQGKRDIDDGFRNYLKPLMKVLERDMKADRELSIEMALLPTDHKNFLKSGGQKYKKGDYHACYDRIYEREYLSLKARLYDGNRLTLSVSDSLTRSDMTKKNPRGKIKTKSKYRKQRITYMIRLRVNPEKYRCKALSEQGQTGNVRKLSLRQTEKGPELTLVYADKRKKQKSDPDVRLTLQLLARLYGNLTPVTSA